MRGVIQGCGAAMDAFCVSMHDPVIWITKALEAAGRGLSDLPINDPQLPEDVRAFIADWIRENRLDRPTQYSAIVVHRHFADNGAYGVSPQLATKMPALAAKCMGVKGLWYKSV